MTVSYILDSSTSTVGSFLRILFRWRGSVWKSVLVEVIVWIVLYYIVFSIYRFSLDTIQQKMFESIGRHIDIRLHLLPLTFMLGFFVTIVVDRWKNIFQNIGFIDSAAFYINTYIRGDEIEINNQRRTLLRYLCLTQVLVLRDISVPVRKRFPNLDSLVDSGLLKKNERELLENIPSVGFNNYWIPINWIFVICYRLRLCGNIVADMLMNAILNEVKVFKEKLQILCNYDWVPVPLAYPQVVFLAVRIYFLLCLVSRQYRINEHEKKQNEKYLQIDRIIPLMTILELFFIMGWVKVAEALLNPLGEDDDDFECNFIIDRNIAMAMTMAEMCYDKTPEQIISDSCDDLFNPQTELAPLYAESIATHPQHPLVGSATLCNLPEEHLPVRMVERQQELKRGSNVDDSLSNTNSTELSTEKGLNLRRFSNISMKKLRNMRQSISIPIQPRFCGGKLSKISEKQIEQIKNGWSPDNLKNSEKLDETLEKQNDINTTPARKLSAPVLLTTTSSLPSPTSPEKQKPTRPFHLPLAPVNEDENLESEEDPCNNKFQTRRGE